MGRPTVTASWDKPSVEMALAAFFLEDRQALTGDSACLLRVGTIRPCPDSAPARGATSTAGTTRPSPGASPARGPTSPVATLTKDLEVTASSAWLEPDRGLLATRMWLQG